MLNEEVIEVWKCEGHTSKAIIRRGGSKSASDRGRKFTCEARFSGQSKVKAGNG
jgi:hypothetical protein